MFTFTLTMIRRKRQTVFLWILVLSAIAFVYLITSQCTYHENNIKDARHEQMSQQIARHTNDRLSDPNYETYSQRKNRMRKTCEEFKAKGGTDLKINYDNLFVDERHKVIYCPVAKVANSNWLRIFVVLMGERKDIEEVNWDVVDETTFKTLSSYDPSYRTHLLNTYTKFMFVRNPYNRILSAFVDKFVEEPDMKVVRPELPRMLEVLSLPNATWVDFEDFIRYLLREKKPETFNNHWIKMHDQCFPCDIDYDIIGKFETLNEDAKHVIHEIGASTEVQFPRPNEHRTLSSAVDIMKGYYSRITKQEVMDLYKLYEWDFKMFGYEIPDIIR
ncbi:carbohydrate sulfotransferase 9-like [Glandiceps talaboti]